MKEQDEINLFEVRKEKLKKLREQGQDYPNSFRRNELAKELIKEYSDLSKDDLENTSISVKVAGRIMLRRLMGKASFTTKRFYFMSSRSILGSMITFSFI